MSRAMAIRRFRMRGAMAIAFASLAACETAPLGPKPDDAGTVDRVAPADDSSTQAGDAANGTDSTDAADESANGDAAGCTDSLTDLNSGMRCAGTYDAALTGCKVFGSPAKFAGICGGLSAVAYSYGTSWFLCVYGGIDGGGLVGMGAEEDIPEFCNGTSNTVTAGQVPDACMSSTSYVSGQLSQVDASCPMGDAAPDSTAD
jgi:hypothetical protein